MPAVDLDLFKKHVRADDFSDDDAYMLHLLDAAEAAVVDATDRTRDELDAIGGGALPVQLVQAIMMLAAHWYNQRESVAAVQMHEVPASLQALVKPFTRLSGHASGKP